MVETYFKVLTQHVTVDIKENRGGGNPVSGQRFVPGIYRLRISNNQSIAVFRVGLASDRKVIMNREYVSCNTGTCKRNVTCKL